MLLVTLAGPAGGCRAAERPGSQSGGIAGAGGRTDSLATSMPDDTLRFHADLPAVVRLGEPVPIVLRVTNGGQQPTELHLQGKSVVFDILVTHPDGRMVWRRLEGQTVPDILQVLRLGPGESLQLRDEWRQVTNTGAPVGAGDYRVRGILPTDQPEPMRTPQVSLRLEPRR